MTQHYVVQVELDRRAPNDLEIDQIQTALDDWWVSVSESMAGNLHLTISVPAEGLRQAVATGLALVAPYGDPLVVSALPQSLRDARQGWEPLPDMLSVTEVAERLHVSRQAVLKRIASGSLPAVPVGTTYAVPAGAVPQSEDVAGGKE